MAKITVKNGQEELPDGGFPVAIWEKNEVHEPDGELYIADGEEHSVEMTGGVGQALADGRLVELRGGKAVARDAEPEAEERKPAAETHKGK